jgi:hypothetical protein
VTQTIAIQGLRETSRALRSLDKQAPKQLRIVFNQAGELVVGYVRRNAPRRTGRAIGSVKTRSTRTSARVSFGGDRAPYYPWLDFGGKVGRGDSVVRPFLKEGRYVYPGLAAHRAEIIKIMQEGLAQAARDAGLEVS